MIWYTDGKAKKRPTHIHVLTVFLLQGVRDELQRQMDENSSLRNTLEVKKNEYQVMKVKQEEEKKRKLEEDLKQKREAEIKRKKEEEARKQKEREMEGKLLLSIDHGPLGRTVKQN